MGETLLLPWAPTTISQITAAVPESDALERVCACVKGVDRDTSLGNGTSVTARIPLANAKFTAGRPHADRPGDARMRRRKPSTPRLNGRAATESSPCLKRKKPNGLRVRVVTQLKVFFGTFVRSAGLF